MPTDVPPCQPIRVLPLFTRARKGVSAPGNQALDHACLPPWIRPAPLTHSALPRPGKPHLRTSAHRLAPRRWWTLVRRSFRGQRPLSRPPTDGAITSDHHKPITDKDNPPSTTGLWSAPARQLHLRRTREVPQHVHKFQRSPRIAVPCNRLFYCCSRGSPQATGTRFYSTDGPAGRVY